MDNRKKALTGSSWPKGTGSNSWRKPEIGKLVGNQEPAGFDGSNRSTGSGLASVRKE